MLAGFDHVAGDCVIVLDADLQQPPETIPQMLDLWEQGYEDVYARRLSRSGESWLRRKLSLWFYGLLQKFTKDDVLRNVGDFRLLDRKCIDALRQLREQERYTKGLFVWIGFRKAEVTYEQAERATGHSSFGFWRLLNLAVDGITSFSIRPIYLILNLGIIFIVIAFAIGLYVIRALIVGTAMPGWSSLMLSIWFVGGFVLIGIGITGIYIGKIYQEVKRRPLYHIQDILTHAHEEKD